MTMKEILANRKGAQSTATKTEVFHITKERYYLTRINGETFVKSQLNLASCNVPFLLVKAGTPKVVTKKTLSGQSVDYVPNHLSEQEFASIISAKPAWKQLSAAYIMQPIKDPDIANKVRNALGTDSPTILW